MGWGKGIWMFLSPNLSVRYPLTSLLTFIILINSNQSNPTPYDLWCCLSRRSMAASVSGLT